MKNSGFIVLFLCYFGALFFFAPLSITATLVSWGWVVLAVLASGVALTGLFNSQYRLPPKKIGIFILGLLITACLFSLINGSNLLEEKWSHRWVTLLLFAGLLQVFSDPQEFAKALRYPLLAFVLFLTGESIYQNIFTCSNSTLGTSCFSSRFYNINMLSQSLLMGVALLDWLKNGAHRKLRWLFHVAITLSLLIIVYSQSRSAYVAIGLYTLSRYWVSERDFLRFFTPLVLSMCLFAADARLSYSSLISVKASSTSYRKELAFGSLRMIRENPLGVGVNNFEYGFIPYRNEGGLEPSIASVDKTPHNDFLLVLTEEGWIVGTLFFLLCSGLFLLAVKNIRAGSAALWPGFFLVILPEMTFQFPSDMHFYGFCVAAVLAFESLGGNFLVFRTKALHRAAALVLILIIGVSGVLRYTETLPAAYSPLYCRLFHDNWKNCGSYFKTHLERRDLSAASQTAAPVINYQKYNFIMLHWDYLLGNTGRNKEIVCNYAALLRFHFTLPSSDVSGCDRNITRQQLDERMTKYSRER